MFSKKLVNKFFTYNSNCVWCLDLLFFNVKSGTFLQYMFSTSWLGFTSYFQMFSLFQFTALFFIISVYRIYFIISVYRVIFHHFSLPHLFHYFCLPHLFFILSVYRIYFIISFYRFFHHFNLTHFFLHHFSLTHFFIFQFNAFFTWLYSNFSPAISWFFTWIQTEEICFWMFKKHEHFFSSFFAIWKNMQIFQKFKC